MEIDNLLPVKTRREWRKWLKANCKTEKYCWIDFSNEIVYLDAVEEALCFGWIDSTKKQSFQRFSPRTKKSNWTELNRERVRRLEKLGLMTDEGRKCLPDTDFEILPEVMNALKSDKETFANFLEFPELYRRIRIDTIQDCLKKNDPELFDSRLKKFIENTKANKMFGLWNDDGRLLDY